MRDDGRQLALDLFVPTIIESRGAGEFVVKTGKPVSRLTVAETAKQLRVSTDTVYRLVNSGVLRADRPSPHRILIHADSLNGLVKDSSDPEFWNQERSAAYSAARK